VLPTLAVHHPFGLPESGFADGSHGDRRHQLANVIRYSDDALADFLEDLLGDPRFENTLVLVASDHGVNWFAPHAEGRQSVLWEDLVWVPLALLGGAWNVEPGVDPQVRQLADIAPTILDRLGIETPNPFVGHSLLRRFEDRDARAFFATANGGRSAGVRIGPIKFWEHFDSSRQWLFDLEADRPERSNRADDPDRAETLAALSRLVRDVYGMNERLIDENRIWNPTYELGREARR
jgi:arylsulfatase A-like enzyme